MVAPLIIAGIAGIAGTLLSGQGKGSGGENSNAMLGGWFSTNTTKKEQNTYSSQTSYSSADQITSTFTYNPVSTFAPNYNFSPNTINNSPYATATAQANPSTSLSNAPALDLSALLKQVTSQEATQTPTMTTGSGGGLLSDLTNPTNMLIIGGVAVGAYYLFLRKKAK